MGPKWVQGPKMWNLGKFLEWCFSWARCPCWQFQKDLKFCTFYPNPNSTVLTNFQLWHGSSSLIFHFIFDELYIDNPKSREDRIDCCNNLGGYVWAKVSFKLIWPTLVDLRVFKVGPRPKNTIFGSVLWIIRAVLKKLKI